MAYPQLTLKAALQVRVPPPSAGTAVQAILSHLARVGLWGPYRWMGKAGNDSHRELRDVNELANAVVAGGIWEARVTPGQLFGQLDASEGLRVNIRDLAALGFTLHLLRTSILRNGTSISINPYESFFLNIRSHLPADVHITFEKTTCVKVLNVSFPKPRPPPYRPNWEPAPLYVVDTHDLPAKPDEFDLRGKYLQSALPSWVRRTKQQGIVVDVWMEHLPNPSMETILSDQAQWLAQALDLPPARGWNDAGDQHVERAALQRAPPYLAMYDPALAHGFADLTVIGNEPPMDALTEPLTWLDAGALPDGRKLSSLSVILASRADAIALRPHAISLGIQRVLYVIEGGSIWDPEPADIRWRSDP